MRRQISAETWEQARIAYASGTLRELARPPRWPQFLGAHALCCPRKTISKRVQKIEYLGFLKVTQPVERVPRTRGLPPMPLNAVVEGK
jgi:hypothetical protein